MSKSQWSLMLSQFMNPDIQSIFPSQRFSEGRRTKPLVNNTTATTQRFHSRLLLVIYCSIYFLRQILLVSQTLSQILFSPANCNCITPVFLSKGVANRAVPCCATNKGLSLFQSQKSVSEKCLEIIRYMKQYQLQLKYVLSNKSYLHLEMNEKKYHSLHVQSDLKPVFKTMTKPNGDCNLYSGILRFHH